MDFDITVIFGAFAVLLGAVFGGVLKLLKELRKILNSEANRRSDLATSRHGDTMGKLKSLTQETEGAKGHLKELKSYSSEQIVLLRTISAGIKELANHSSQQLELLRDIKRGQT